MYASWDWNSRENRVEVLLGTSCNGIIAKREFINEEDFTGSMSYVMTVDCSLKEAPIAEIRVNISYFMGVTVAVASGKLELLHSQGLKLKNLLLSNP